ncbi:reverse transcriptase zinc-binding domain-containing protein [Tanacetum coccineum]|uniref:Reverse transcriptase zinc-binding domain-containing protein n=1 Tax=Tanacetum coccineum TaxID=301880 RepID=A0ABQ4WBX1_9ASTR
MYDRRFSASMTVEDWMDQSNGIWPEGWIDKFPSLQNLQNVRLDAQTKDIIKWRKKDGSLCNFSVNHTYRELLRNDDDAEWWKIIWFSLNIPKHAFIVWLAVQNKLTTQDKIKQWGSYDVMCCALCRRDLDSHSHLFFECDYSKEFWDKVNDKMGVCGSNYNWNGIVADMSRKFNGNSINSIVRRLCFAASVYLVWQERNSRIFRDEARSTEELFKILIDVVRMRLLSLKVKRSTAVLRIQERWNVITIARSLYLGVLLGRNSIVHLRWFRWPWEDLDFFCGSIEVWIGTDAILVLMYLANGAGNEADVAVLLESIRAVSASSSTGLFFYQSSSMDGLDSMLENDPWFIRNNPLILKKWNPNDGLSAIAMKIGTPLMLDSYTSDMCIQSWGRSSYATALIEIQADMELKDTIVVVI